MPGPKVKQLVQIILNAPDLWEPAAGHSSSTTGGMTPGGAGRTLDGYSHERAAHLRARLRANRSVPSPVQSADVPKPKGKQRPLGRPTTNDTHVQGVWRRVLESIDAPVCKERAHGFRRQRACHPALTGLKYGTGTTWFLEFDREGSCDNLDPTILMGR